jgi:deferrochelatase/peroxidase EfeB
MVDSQIDYSDVQGLVRFGHGKFPEACFLLLRVEDAAAARSWLAQVSITTAQTVADPPDTARQVAFTCEGLQALGIPAKIIEQFAPEFISGMAGDESRSRRLGDIGTNAPAQWQWGGPGNVPHLLLMLYARRGKLDEWSQTMTRSLPQGGVSLLKRLDTAELDGYEPFGFRDGISQPELDWSLQRQAGTKDQIAYGNLVALGEFLLGYPNEYGQYTERPLIDATGGASATLLPAMDQPGKNDLGRNGTYLVLRHLRQDVQGFWQFLDQQANAHPALREVLAEAMVGRTREGMPLASMTAPHHGGALPPGDRSLNEFTFAGDQNGVRCPFGAHIRRANPRNADLPDGTSGLLSRLLRTLGFCRESIRTDAMSSVRFHRLLRRGRKYGPVLTPEQAIRDEQPDNEERGLYFICLNANVGRQFEFVQNAWIMGTKFNGLTEESDPLLGNRTTLQGNSAADAFSLPQPDGVRRRLTGIPQFVSVRGGAYFFLPSIRAIRYLANANG